MSNARPDDHIAAQPHSDYRVFDARHPLIALPALQA